MHFLTSTFSKNNSKIKLLTGRLLIILDSVEELSTNYSPLLYCSNLSGRVGFTSITFDQNPLILQTNGNNTLNGVIQVSNNSVFPINLFIQKNSKEHTDFSIQPEKFQLAINENAKIKIAYSPTNSMNYIKYFLHLYLFYIQTLFVNNLYFILVKLVFVYKWCLHKKSFFLKSTVLNLNVMRIYIDNLYSYFYEYKYFITADFQHKSSPSLRPISPWSSSSSSAGIYL